MKKRLLQWLVCPICHEKLDLKTAQETGSGDITTGALSCGSCRVYFPIYQAVPRMLVYSTAVTTLFSKENHEWIKNHLSDFSFPERVPPPGERDILKSFSKEWTDYQGNNERHWSFTQKAYLASKRYELGLDKHSLNNQLGLEIGIGLGVAGNAISASENCEIIGMDLGYTVDQANHLFSENQRFHIVQASLFFPPFRNHSFNFVYSHGVLHHTYSTQAAFDSIAKLPKNNGGMLYIWLYSHEAAQASSLRRALMLLENIARPILSRLPIFLQTVALLPLIPFYMGYQNFYRRKKEGKEAVSFYGWREALHAARDRFSHRFAHRHSYEEVIQWFKAKGYSALELLRNEPSKGRFDILSLNIGIRGFLTEVSDELQHSSFSYAGANKCAE